MKKCQYCGENNYYGEHICKKELQAKDKEISELKAKIQQIHKDYGFEMRDPNGTIWECSAKLQDENVELKKENDKLKKWVKMIQDVGSQNEFNREEHIIDLERQLEKAVNFINSNVDLEKVGICKSCRYRDYPCTTKKYCKQAIRKYLEDKDD